MTRSASAEAVISSFGLSSTEAAGVPAAISRLPASTANVDAKATEGTDRTDGSDAGRRSRSPQMRNLRNHKPKHETSGELDFDEAVPGWQQKGATSTKSARKRPLQAQEKTDPTQRRLPVTVLDPDPEATAHNASVQPLNADGNKDETEENRRKITPSPTFASAETESHVD